MAFTLLNRMPDPLNTLVVAAAICIDTSGRILLGRRRPTKKNAGLWELPGGKVESEETAPEALVRELREELGIESRIIQHYMDSVSPTPTGTLLLTCFLVELHNPAVQSTDHDLLQWYSPHELARVVSDEGLVSAPDIPVLKQLLVDCN